MEYDLDLALNGTDPYDFIAENLWPESTIPPFFIEYMVVSAIIGIIAIEFSFTQSSRYLDGDEERDSAYPLCRRLDVKNWARWKLYPGAMLFMPTRLLLLIVSFLVMTGTVRVLCLFHNFEKGPITGIRKSIIKKVIHYMSLFILVISGLRYEKKHIDFDYSKYLGPNYKNEKRKSPYTSTYVSNHVSLFDSLILFCCFECSFAPTKGVKEIPGVGNLAKAVDCIFIPRGSSEEARNQTVEIVMQR